MKNALLFKEEFDNFDVAKISQYSDEKVKTLLQNAAIIRNRKKIEATINNAKIVLKLPKSLMNIYGNLLILKRLSIITKAIVNSRQNGTLNQNQQANEKGRLPVHWSSNDSVINSSDWHGR